MAVSDEEIAFAKDLFSDLGDITTRKMMGGLCLYHQGVIFALLYADGSLWIKAQDGFIDHMKSLGASQWTYQREGRDKPTAMPYWSLPESALDDPEEAVALARQALEFLS